MTKTALMLSAAAWSLPVAAQSPDEEAIEPDARTIVVTGEGLRETPSTAAYATRVIDREALVATGSGRIEDALANVAGFQQFRRSDSRAANPSAQGATLRGLGGNATSRALVTLDGVPLNDPFFGYIPFSAIAPERLGSARITRGGGSGPFGAGALAGTIELLSASPSTLGLVSGRALVSERGDSEASATIAPELGAGFAVLSGRWDHGPGYFTTPEEQRVAASSTARFDSWSVEGRGVAPLSGDTELQARMLVFDDQRTLRFDGADSTSSGADASVRVVGTGRWAFDALAYVQARNFSNVVISSTRFVPVLDQRNTPSTGLGAKIEVRPPMPQGHVLRTGADFREARGQLSEFAISAFSGAVTARRSAGGVTSDLGLFVEHDWTSGPLTLSAGVRGDRTSIRDGFFRETSGSGAGPIEIDRFADRSDWSVSVRGGAVLRLNDRVSVRGAGYTGLRVPTLNELYRPFTVFPVVTLANAELTNERLEGYEIGVAYEGAGRTRLQLTAFDNRVKDAVANVTLEENLRQRQNIDAIRARGVEADASISRGPFAFEGSLALIDAEARGSGLAAALNGNRPAQTPRFAASLSAAYRFQGNGLAKLTLRHTGDQFEDDLESDRLAAATVLDAFIRFPLARRFDVILRGENLTDSKVVTRNQGGSIDLGQPRTLWLGIGYGL